MNSIPNRQQQQMNEMVGGSNYLYHQQQYQQYLQQQQLQLQEYLHQQSNGLTMEQIEYEQIRQLQEQATLQQQRAHFYQQMMYYQQELEQPYLSATTPMYSPNHSPSPPTSHHQDPMIDNIKAQKRAEHNAIERARRESLNVKLQQLARSLPNLQKDNRPSKGTIIARTLEYVKETVEKEQKLQEEIEKLRQSNENLIKKMTSEHFDQSDDEDYENTPDCDVSSHSSITSISSSHQFSHSPNLFQQKQDSSLYNMNNVSIQF